MFIISHYGEDKRIVSSDARKFPSANAESIPKQKIESAAVQTFMQIFPCRKFH